MQELLDLHEVAVTRAVTEAVTADVTARFEADLERCHDRIRSLEEELTEAYERLNQVNLEVDRIRRHPVVRIARSLRRVAVSRRSVEPGRATGVDAVP